MKTLIDITRKTKGVADDVDKYVGKRLRIRRFLLGLSQEKLADEVGVTFQQIQKYERGSNRVSAGRLLKFSQVLDVPVNYFYEDIEQSKPASKILAGLSDNGQDSFESEGKISDDNIMERRETLDLVRSYYSVSDPKKRKDILKFIKSMTKNIS